jgi:ubiquinone/menaquinone biosynthesis C-methylase UbiE
MKKLWMILAGSIATVVVAAIAIGPTTLKRWAYEEPGRDDWQQPDRVIAELGLEPGDVVADLGAGGGYFTFRLATAVGPTGKVLAVDVDRGLLDYVAAEAERRGLYNVETVRAAGDDPRLPEEVDLLFTCNTVHHFDDRTSYFRGARRYLRPDARVAIIDYVDKHRSAPPEVLAAEMSAADYRLEKRNDFLEKQSFLIFAASGDADGGDPAMAEAGEP